MHMFAFHGVEYMEYSFITRWLDPKFMGSVDSDVAVWDTWRTVKV